MIKYADDAVVSFAEAMLFRMSKRLKLQSRELKIIYNGTPISFVKEYIYLENVIDNTLTLNTNFSCSYKQASNQLRLLKRVREYLNVDAATKIFSMIILPILTYTGPVKWSYTRTQTERLDSLMRRAKAITRNESLDLIYDVIQRQNCMLVKKCLQNQLNSVVFNNYFEVMNHERNTRNNNFILRLPTVKLECAKQGFYFGGAKLFNSLPLELRLEHDFVKFRSQLHGFRF